MKRIFSMLLIFAMVWSLLPQHEAMAAETTEDMVLWYKLDEASGTTATDSSGNGNNGVLTGGATWGGNGLTFDGTNGYIKVPNNIMEGVTSTTVAFEVFMETSQATPYMLFAFGNTGSNGVGNGYFFMSGNSFRSSLSLTNWQGEQNAGTNSNLARGIWKHVAITVSGSTAILYEDGKEVGRNTAITVNPSQIGGGVTTANYIGKSVYTADKYFKGKMQDFRMYNRALSVTEVQDLVLPTNLQAVAQDKSDLTLGDTSGVTGNLTLPTLGQNGSTITWQSSDEAIVANNGTVVRPESSEGDKTVTLTATLQRGSTLDTKQFSVTVISITNVPVTGVNLVQETIEMGVGEQQQLTAAVTPADATNKALIWSTDNESIADVDAFGVVRAMAAGTANVTVKTVDGSFMDTAAVHVSQPAGSDAELILHYDMNDMAGSAVKDQMGNFDGTWVNPELADWIQSDEAGALIFKGGSTSSYVTMPQGVLDGLTDVTVSTLVNWNGASQANWMYTFGQNSSKYLYFTPDYPNTSGARFGMATNAWNNEVSAKAPRLTANQWKLVTTVMSGRDGTLTLYVDGVKAATDNTSYTLEQIRNAQGISGFIGKSMYGSDPYFGGMIADFKVYNGALTPLEVSDLTTEANTKIAAMDGMLLNYVAENLNAKILGQNSSLNDVTSHLVLSENGEFSTTVTWESSDVSIISNEGVVTRPSYEAGDQTVTLTATISDGTNTITKLIVVSVKSLPSDSASVQMDKEALTVNNINDVRGHLTLSSAGENGTSITWTSSNPAVITATGEVTRPAHGSGNVIVTLIATVAKNAESASKTYQAVVKELPVQEDYTGYFFSYFVGEGSVNGEQIYSALSQGNDPLHWTELNDGNPVLTSELGEKGVRDPFIIRSPEGDKFYMIATDLSIYNNGNWDRAQRQGSRSIMVWESNDLVNWSEQRMVEISPPEAGNTWAPEISYDETTGEYIVFWASKLYEDETHSGNTYNKMMYAKTRDFYTFTEAEVYMDFGYSVIDTTIIKHDGKVYRFTKDERDNSSSTPYGKTIFEEVGDTILGNFEMIKEGVGNIKWVEGPTIFKSNTEEKWYLFVDEFGGRGYIPFETTDLDSGEWVLSTNYELPNHPRHGTVLPITQTEYEAIYNKYLAEPVAVTGVSLDPAVEAMHVGDEMQLTATIAPVEATNKSLTWSSSDPDVATVTAEGLVKAVAEGTAIITVTTVDGGFTANITVTVEAVVVPPTGEISDVEVISRDRQLALTWSDPTDIDLAFVKIVIFDGETVNDTVHINKGEQSYIVTALTNGKEYTIKISAVDSEGNEYPGIGVMGTPMDTTPPAEVTHVKVTQGNKILTLRWDNPSDSDLYQIKISGYGDTQIETVYLKKNAEILVFTGLSNGTNYEFLITTIDQQGNESLGILVQGVPIKPGNGGTTNNPNS